MYGNTADCPCFKTIITLYNIRTSYLQIQNTEYMYSTSIQAVLNITVIHNQVDPAGGIQACTKYTYFGLTKYGVLVVRIYLVRIQSTGTVYSYYVFVYSYINSLLDDVGE